MVEVKHNCPKCNSLLKHEIDGVIQTSPIPRIAKSAFKLRAMLINEKLRVEETADAPTWNALEIFSELAKEITDALTPKRPTESESC